MITREVISGDSSRMANIEPEQKISEIDGKKYPFEWNRLGDGVYHMRTGSHNYRISIISFDPPDHLLFQVNGKLYQAEVRDEQQQLLKKMGFEKAADSGITELKAPMPGKVLEIPVNEGTEISVGQPLVILEAMKMENELRSTCSGQVDSVIVKSGDSVEKYELLMTITRK